MFVLDPHSMPPRLRRDTGLNSGWISTVRKVWLHPLQVPLLCDPFDEETQCMAESSQAIGPSPAP